MLTKKCFQRVWVKNNCLISAPPVEKRASSYELFSAVFDDESFEKAFSIWISKNQKWPTHIELKNALKPKILKYNREQLVSAKPKTRPFLIWEWISNNLNVPKVDGHSIRVRTTAQLHDWNKTVNIAINTFYKQLDEGDIDYDFIISGSYHATLDHDDNAFNESVPDEDSSVAVKDIPETKQSVSASQAEIAHRKSLPTYHNKPWLY